MACRTHLPAPDGRRAFTHRLPFGVFQPHEVPHLQGHPWVVGQQCLVAQRWSDPAFPVAFPDFGSAGYWGQQALQLREQLRVAADMPSLAALL